MSEAVQIEEPVVDAPVADAPVVEQAAGHEPTLLELTPSPGADEPAAAEPVVEPVAPVVEPAPDAPIVPVVEPAPEPATPELIAYPEWKMPDGVTADKDKIAKFNDILGGARVSPEVGQALLDHHVATIQQIKTQLAEHASSEQFRIWGETQKNWVNEARADPEIGGSGFDTSMGAIARVRDALVSTSRPGTPQYAKDEAAFNQFLAVTGAGNHPQFLKMLHRASKFVDEPGMGPSSIKPPANMGEKPKSLRDVYKANREARDAQ